MEMLTMVLLGAAWMILFPHYPYPVVLGASPP